MKLSLCLEMVFTDRPFIERMAIASRIGYGAIEFWDWRDKDVAALADAAAQHELTIAAMSGNRRHPLIEFDSDKRLVEEMEEVFEVADRLICRNIMMLSDVLNSDGSAVETTSGAEHEKIDNVVENLRKLAGLAEKSNLTLLLEPLNTALDHRGCFLNSSALGVEIVKRVGSSRVKLLYDIYHMSMMNEDVLEEIDKNLDWIGYFHVADLPGRHEPGTGKINYRGVNELLKRTRYEGFVGMEFSPQSPDEQAAAKPLEVFS
jgi:hydroxypyruvate isomerase